jgi:hypothetical protein
VRYAHQKSSAALEAALLFFFRPMLLKLAIDAEDVLLGLSGVQANLL